MRQTLTMGRLRQASPIVNFKRRPLWGSVAALPLNAR